ncbi:hypothetical protein [uncultured Erythrobacter sp.]|uniref:hypothetical protein n=1 Tax=uncultured Erythrobacter sp. TaxID=263913 RepID=UPI0026188420|nr:hypothetical protein [uncultured Erythrobacter sp.]
MVAVAVTAVLSPVGTATFGQAVLAAAGGSPASQGVGLATGIQKKFSFKSLALSAVSAGVTNGIGPEGFLGGANGLFGKGLEGAIARGALSSAITQGIGVATGLRDKFSFAGVAAAGVAAGVGNLLGGKLKPLSGDGAERTLKNIAGHIAVGAARSIASAATRSAIEGSSFSRALAAGLPDVIGQVVGQAIGGAIDGGSSRAGRVAGSTSLPQAANRTSINQPHKIAALADGSVPIEIPLIELDPISTPTLNLGKVAEQTIRAEHQGHIIVTGTRLIDVNGAIDLPYSLDGTSRPLFKARGLEGDARQSYFATVAVTQSGQDGAIVANLERQAANGAAFADRIYSENPAWHPFNRSIAEFLGEGATLVPEAASFYEAAASQLSSRIDGGKEIELAVLADTALSIGEIWVDTASLVLAPIAVLDVGYDYAQGRVSTTDLALEFLPTRAIGKIGRAISTKVDDVPPLNARAFNRERVGPWQSPNDISINTSRVNGALDAPVVRPIHKNSLDYVGDTHVYAIRRADGKIVKIGESAQGTRVGDGASIRGEAQARALSRETGVIHESEIRAHFNDKASARAYETKSIETFRRLFGANSLPLNKTNR